MELFSVGTLETAQGNTKLEKLIFPRHAILCFSCPAGRALWRRLIEVLRFVGNLSGPFVHVPEITFVYRLEKPDRPHPTPVK